MGKNMLIGQSGGPTAVINASLAGAVRAAAESGEIDKIYGARYGVQGLLDGRVADLRKSLQSEEDYRRLACTPSMALGSCRYRLPDIQEDRAPYERLDGRLRELDVGYFFYIGGNDSMDTVHKLSDYFHSIGEDIKVVGIPKTIDNDLALTDHTPGYGSAAKFIATTVMEIARDAQVYDLDAVTIVEIMGRDAGWLAASSVLARQDAGAPHLIYLPETPFYAQRFIHDVRALQQKGVRSVVAAVSEGLRAPDGTYAADAYQNSSVDVFGHRSSLAGVGRWLEGLARRELGCKVRAVELNVLQRAAAHMQSKTDLEEARDVGAAAVRMALAGETGVMAVLRRARTGPYAVTYESAPVNAIANHAHTVPREWITPDGNDVTQELVEYIRPLILGEVDSPSQCGLPHHFTF